MKGYYYMFKHANYEQCCICAFCGRECTGNIIESCFVPASKDQIVERIDSGLYIKPYVDIQKNYLYKIGLIHVGK